MGFTSAQRYLSPFDLRDRLKAFMEADPVWGGAANFPAPIKRWDPLGVSAAQRVDVALVVAGQNMNQDGLGTQAQGTGFLEVEPVLVLLVYSYSVSSATENPDADPSEVGGLGMASCGDLTMRALQAMFRYEVDPTPGSQGWWQMRLMNQPPGIHTAYFSQKGFEKSKTVVLLRSRQQKL